VDDILGGRKFSLTNIPGLNPEAPFFSRLSARSALYTELQLLLDRQPTALPARAYRSLVIDENFLARPSIWARRKLWEELHCRYRLDAHDELFKNFWMEWQSCGSDLERGLTAYVLLALNDRLVTDLGVEWLFPLLVRAPAELRAQEVRAFIEREAVRHAEVLRWSEKTASAVAQKYCASIRDFGLAKGIAKKVTVRPSLHGAPVRLLLRALRLIGTADLEIIRHRIFRLLGIDVPQVITALGELNRLEQIRFRMQGDVVELDLQAAA
jgi:hypothetical protein